MAVGKRYVTLESETKGFNLPLMTAARASTFSYTGSLSIPGAVLGEPQYFLMAG